VGEGADPAVEAGCHCSEDALVDILIRCGGVNGVDITNSHFER